MPVPELPIGGSISGIAAGIRFRQREMEVEIELREAKLHWVALLCSCLDAHPSKCQVHGAILILPDGRVV